MFGLLVCNCCNSQFSWNWIIFARAQKELSKTVPATVLIGQSCESSLPCSQFPWLSATIPMTPTTRPFHPWSKIQGVHRIAIEPWKNPIVFGFLEGTSPDSLQPESSKKGLEKTAYRREISWLISCQNLKTLHILTLITNMWAQWVSLVMFGFFVFWGFKISTTPACDRTAHECKVRLLRVMNDWVLENSKVNKLFLSQTVVWSAYDFWWVLFCISFWAPNQAMIHGVLLGGEVEVATTEVP